MGVYVEQYAAFWLEQDGFPIRKIARHFNNPSVKSAYPIFEWTKTSKRDKITALIDVAHVASRGDTTWSLELKRRYIWCPIKSLIMTLETNTVNGSDCIKEEDVAKIEEMLPRLESLEKERQIQESREKERARRERKDGPPESMTIVLLKEVLREISVIFKPNLPKKELVQKVKEARQKLGDRSECALACSAGVFRGQCRRFPWARVVFIVRDRVDSPPCWMRVPSPSPLTSFSASPLLP